MRMKRWGSMLLLLTILLSACGTTQTPDSAISQSGVQATTTPDGPYPMPAATDVPLATATVELPRVTATVEVTEEAIVNTLVDSTQISMQPRPITATLFAEIEGPDVYPESSIHVAGWSPDGQYILYFSTGNEAVHLFVSHIPSNTRIKVTEKAIASGVNRKSYGVYDYDIPRWDTTCCSFYYSILRKQENVRDIMHVSLDGLELTQQTIQIIPNSQVLTYKDNDIVSVNSNGLLITNQQRSQQINVPRFNDGMTRNTVQLSPSNRTIAFSDKGTVLVVTSIAPDSSPMYTIPITDIVDFNPERYGSRYFIDHPTWSPNETKIAFWVNNRDFATLWILDVPSGTLKHYAQVQSKGPEISWSPKSDYIGWAGFTEEYAIARIMHLEDEVITDISKVTYGAIPVWDATGRFIAIVPANTIRRKYIHIYELSEQ